MGLATLPAIITHMHILFYFVFDEKNQLISPPILYAVRQISFRTTMGSFLI
jgi:hypothetical protein